MQSIKIQCPGCHNKYNLKTANRAAIMSKTFNCPKCGFSVQFSMLLGGAGTYDNPSLHTHIANVNNVQAGPKTKVSSSVQAAQNRQMALIVESTGAQYILYPGIYILGRDSIDSKATLKIAPDPFMSRQHARLAIDANVGTMQCKLCGLTSTNPIFINNKKIAAGNSVVLKPGDRILLGMTTVIFTTR